MKYMSNIYVQLIGGVNNTWHSKKKSYESQLYSDTSVMENTHISCFFEMMKKKPELSIVDSIADPNVL